VLPARGSLGRFESRPDATPVRGVRTPQIDGYTCDFKS
jgi:hypothetical protein